MKLSKGLKITYLGHSTFRLELGNGKRIIIDPWLQGNPVCPESEKKIDQLDLILVTHGHFDHLGDTASLMGGTQARLIAIPEICAYVGKQGVGEDRMLSMNKGGTLPLPDLGIKVTMTNAFHSGGIMDPGGILYGGEPSGYVIEFEDGFRLYHAGDTCVFGDMKIIGELYKPDVAMLPIGDRYTMSPREAAYAIRLLGVKCVIPMHFATFPLLTGTPEMLRDEAKDVAGLEVVALKPGETAS
ncbi:MAG: metal-dependent hydrolase [Chloroflexi bacterium]|nr:metal-dependent hydrolase [Chloroflexota bacterium]